MPVVQALIPHQLKPLPTNQRPLFTTNQKQSRILYGLHGILGTWTWEPQGTATQHVGTR
jgi:hypothetical protein